MNLGWKLAAVLQGWSGPALLDTYEAERQPIVTETIASAEANMGTLSTDLAARADRSEQGALAAAIQRGKRAEFHSLGLVLGYTYAGSPVVQPGPTPERQDATCYVPTVLPGARLPHLWVGPGQSLYDLLGRGLTLLGPLNRASQEVTTLQRRAAELRVPLTVVDAPAAYPWASDFLLVRPDQHIAWKATSPRDIDLETATGRASSGGQG